MNFGFPAAWNAGEKRAFSEILTVMLFSRLHDMYSPFSGNESDYLLCDIYKVNMLKIIRFSYKGISINIANTYKVAH